MGFGSFFKHLVKIKPKKLVKKIGGAVATGGLSLVPGAKNIVKPYTNLVEGFYDKALSNPLQFGAKAGLAYATGNPYIFLSDFGGAPQGGQPMALNFGNLLGSVGQIFGGNQNPYFQGISNVASFAQPFATALQPMRPTMAAPTKAGQVQVIPRSGLTQEIATAAQKLLARLGIRYALTTGGLTSALRRALGPIATLARRTPGGTIVSILVGLGLTAYEANLLTAWQTQHRRGRRMNPANAKALRRAARRIRSFHKLCTHTDLLKSRSRGVSRSRCGTCRKSPCRC